MKKLNTILVLITLSFIGHAQTWMDNLSCQMDQRSKKEVVYAQIQKTSSQVLDKLIAKANLADPSIAAVAVGLNRIKDKEFNPETFDQDYRLYWEFLLNVLSTYFPGSGDSTFPTINNISAEILKYIDIFQEKGHLFVPSIPLPGEQDPNSFSGLSKWLGHGLFPLEISFDKNLFAHSSIPGNMNPLDFLLHDMVHAANLKVITSENGLGIPEKLFCEKFKTCMEQVAKDASPMRRISLFYTLHESLASSGNPLLESKFDPFLEDFTLDYKIEDIVNKNGSLFKTACDYDAHSSIEMALKKNGITKNTNHIKRKICEHVKDDSRFLAFTYSPVYIITQLEKVFRPLDKFKRKLESESKSVRKLLALNPVCAEIFQRRNTCKILTIKNEIFQLKDPKVLEYFSKK